MSQDLLGDFLLKASLLLWRVFEFHRLYLIAVSHGQWLRRPEQPSQRTHKSCFWLIKNNVDHICFQLRIGINKVSFGVKLRTG